MHSKRFSTYPERRKFTRGPETFQYTYLPLLYNISVSLVIVRPLVTHEWTHDASNDHTWNYAQVKMHKSESLPRLLLLFVRSHVALPSAAYDYVRYLVYNKYIYYWTMRCIDMVQNISYHHGEVWSLKK